MSILSLTEYVSDLSLGICNALIMHQFDSDNIEGIKALLGALKSNFEVTKRKVKLIHFVRPSLVLWV